MPVPPKPVDDPNEPDLTLADERERMAIALAWARTPERFPALTARVVERMRRALRENAGSRRDQPEPAAAEPGATDSH